MLGHNNHIIWSKLINKIKSVFFNMKLQRSKYQPRDNKYNINTYL